MSGLRGPHQAWDGPYQTVRADDRPGRALSKLEGPMSGLRIPHQTWEGPYLSWKGPFRA